nr:hypothetical protein [Desulfogranum marinum]
MNAIPESGGMASKNNSKASNPPADAPIPTMGKVVFLLKREKSLVADCLFI